MAGEPRGGESMTDINFLQSDAEVPNYASEVLKPRISLTSDVLDFRKCERKYGMYKIRNFQPSAPTAEFVGTFSHRSLETAWRFAKQGHVLTQEELTEEMERIRNQLVNEEKRNPHSWNAVLKAGRQVIRMHLTLASRGLYDSWFDSERRFRLLEGEFVMEGVVDALLDVDGEVTLIDWKSANDPRGILNSDTATERSRNYAQRVIDDYSLQLKIYHHLYDKVVGVAPSRCIIVYLGEIPVPAQPLGERTLVDAWNDTVLTALTEEEWNHEDEKSSVAEQKGLFFTVDTSEDEITSALEQFRSTAQEIVRCRSIDRWSAPETAMLPDKQTCQDCDFRTSCPSLISDDVLNLDCCRSVKTTSSRNDSVRYERNKCGWFYY